MFEKVAELSAQSKDAADRDLREVLRTAAASDKDNFSKMLVAFEQMVETLLRLDDQDASFRQSAIQTLKEVNRLAQNGKQVKQKISGFNPGIGKPMPGFEQDLQELAGQTVRELADDQGSLKTRKSLEDRWERLSELLESLRRAKNNLSVLRAEYDTQVARFFREQEYVQLYKGERARQEKAIRHAQEFFGAAGFNPFELSDKLAGIDQGQVSTMPDCEARDAIQASAPEDFPSLEENRIISRAENVIGQVENALKDLSKVAVKPVMPQVPPTPAPVKPVAVQVSPAPASAKPPVLPLTSRQAPVQLGSCPITFVGLAVCTYAVFVRRLANGKPQATSGRPIDRVYANILIPSGMGFGCTQDQFRQAVLEGISRGLINRFQLKGKDLYQPTIEGFARAEELYPQLPKDFKQRILEGYNAVKQVDGVKLSG